MNQHTAWFSDAQLANLAEDPKNQVYKFLTILLGI